MSDIVKENIANYLPDGAFDRSAIFDAARKIDSNFKETLLRNLIQWLKTENIIIHNGRNLYTKAGDKDKKSYSGLYSKRGKKILRHMEKNFPLLEYRVWEFVWLNEFMNHQITRNYIFVEVEKMSCGFVYDSLVNNYRGEVLLNPRIDDVVRYGNSDGIIIEKLVSESPEGFPNKHSESLEKMIVDLYSNKLLMSMLSKGDYEDGIKNMYKNYYINTSAMLRYASRRNRYDEVKKLLESNELSK